MIRCIYLILVCVFTVGSVPAQVTAVIVPSGDSAWEATRTFPPYPVDGRIPPQLQHHFLFSDPASGDVMVSYPEELENLSAAGSQARRTFRVKLGRKVAPEVSVQIEKEPSGTYLYRYTVRNLNGAAQPIENWYLSILRPKSQNPHTPEVRPYPLDRSGVWDFLHFGYRPGFWSVQWKSGTHARRIVPGAQSSEFAIEAREKPGFQKAFFQGPLDLTSLPDNLPQAVTEQLSKLHDLEYNSRWLKTIGPRYNSQDLRLGIAVDYQVEITTLLSSRIPSLTGRYVGPGVYEMSARHLLENASLSPFMRELLEALQEFIDYPRPEEIDREEEKQLPFREIMAKPTNQEELELYQAVRLAMEVEG